MFNREMRPLISIKVSAGAIYLIVFNYFIDNYYCFIIQVVCLLKLDVLIY